MADVTISNLPPGVPSGSVVLPYSDGTSTLTARPSAIVAASPGCILQIKQAVKRDVQTYYEGSYGDITNLSVNITPKTLTSSFMLMGTISMTCGTSQAPSFRFIRNNTDAIGVGNAEGLRYAATTWTYVAGSNYIHSVPINFLDNTVLTNLNTINYKIQVRGNNPNNGQGIWINSNQDDTNAYNQARCISTLTVWEIAG